MLSLRKSFAISAFSKYILLILQFISTTILARLLTPEDIGIYSIAFSIVLFGHLIRNFGINQFIIQEKDLTDDKIRAAFSLTLIIAWSVAAILFFGADQIGELYKNTGISNVLKLLSINFLLLPISTITHSYLRRKMEFKKVAVIDIIPGFFGVTVAVTSAYLGAKFYTMAYAAITEIFVTIIISFFYRPKELPFWPGIKMLGYVFSFGSKIGLSNIVTQLSRSLTELFIGRLLGLAPLGMFSRAYGTFMLFEYAILDGIGPVILPLFSQTKNKGGNLRKVFLRSIEYTTAFSMPFFAFLFCFTEDIIHVLYGWQWDEAIPLIKIFCFAGVFISIFSFFDQIMISVNKTGVVLRFQLLSHVFFIALLIQAAASSLTEVVWCFFAATIVRLFLSLSYYKKFLSLKFSQLIRIFFRGIFFTIALMLPSTTLFFLEPNFSESAFIRLPVLMLMTFISWIVFLFIFRHPFKNEIQLVFAKISRSK